MTRFSRSVSIFVVVAFTAANLAAGSPAPADPTALLLRPSFSLAASPPPRPPEGPPSMFSPPPAKPAVPPAERKPGFKPKPLLAAAEVAGINLGVWAFLLYFGDAFYSYISWETIADNLTDGWEWDRSQYFVNFYHHPYHGYLYYSAGRSSGLSYWGSALAALGGSLMWEMMMEKYRPSINDWITTTCGGIVYGEIGHRFSALVRKSDARGLGRIWREFVGTVCDPVGGVNRLLNGREDVDPWLPGSPDVGRILNGELVVTGPVAARSAELTGTRGAPLLGFTLAYGDPAGTGWSGKPFDVFTVRGRLRWGPDRPHLSLFVNGALFGKGSVSANGNAHFLGVYQHYEYYGFDTMRVCGTSLTGGWTSRFVPGKDVRLTAGARLGWMGLGGSDDFLGNTGERREYNLGTGWVAAAEAAIAAKGFEYFSVIWRHYGLFNLRVIGSRPGRESWNILQAQVAAPILSRLGIGAVIEYCGRSFDLEGYDPGSRRLYEARAFLTWQF